MKNLYLLFICLMTSVSFSFGQNREVLSLDFEYQQVEGTYRNTDPSCKGLKAAKEEQETIFESQDIAVSLQDIAPFLSVSMKWQASGVVDHHDIELQIRTSVDAQNWEEWKSIHTDGHAPVKKDTYFSELMYFDENTRFIQTRIVLKKQSVIFKKIDIHLYSPGITLPVKTGQKQSDIKSDPLQSSCPCDQPNYLSRNQWCPGGNCPPSSNPASTSPTHLIVHHSAGVNSSSDWAAVVRSIWDYHVNVNNWDDIGYNWLIDRNGAVYEGRGAGIRGAHFCGNNTGTQGNCILGNFNSSSPSNSAYNKAVELLAWQSCQYNINPTSTSYHGSSGFSFNNIAGHQQGCSTECPGSNLYSQLGNLRAEVSNYISDCGAGDAACLAPTNLSISSIGTTTAAVSFNDPNNMNGNDYTIALFDAASGQLLGVQSGLTDINISISGLSECTSYEARIVTDCNSINEVSDAVSINFTTNCNDNEDIFLTNVAVSSTNVNCGDDITMSCTQNYSGNQLDADLPSFDVDYYLSTNTTFDNSDILLGGDASSLGSDDTSHDENDTGVIPTDTSPETYYVLFVADSENELAETNENNNIEYIQIQVTCAPTTYTVSVTANPNNGGTVTGGGTYTSGSSATVTANANSNWTFTNWTENGAVAYNNSSYPFTVTSNRSLVANFAYTPPPPPSACRQSDSLALVALYQSTNGINWGTNWPLTQPISTWHGITLNAEGCVTHINLNQNNLVGTIPAEIGNLSALIRLNMYSNKLSGSIPVEIGNLSELHQIWLFSNQLSGELPSEIGNLSNLTHLGIGGNQLTGTIPSSYGNLSNLSFLTVKNNNLSGCFDDNLLNICAAGNDSGINTGNSFDTTWSAFCTTGDGGCTPPPPPPSTCRYLDSLVLVKIHQSTNGANWTTQWNFATPIHTWYGIALNANGCVTEINLSNNNLTGTIPPEIGQLAALTRLNMHSNNLSGNTPSTIGNLSELLQIWLFKNQLSGMLPPEIGNLSNLTHFGAGVNQLTGTIPGSYGNLSNLGFFTIPQNQLSGCFDANLVNICDAASNANINSGNNFDALWSDFCANGAGSCSPPPPPTNCSTDSLTMVDLYYATNGQNWTITWNLNEPMNTWYGLILNADGCVEQINLPNNNLVGTLPTAIGGLSALVRLNLHTNQLSGSIPTSIGNITTLEQIWLFSNQMTGTLPPEIGNLSNLTHLGLGLNQFTGGIPASYGNLSNLGFLALKGNNLSGCYDINLANICDAGTDSRVSSGNNFSASWSNFCTSAAGCCNCRLEMNRDEFENDSFDKRAIILHPNPAKNTFHITGLDDRMIKQLSIFDMSGKVVQTLENPSNSIDVSNVVQGMYVVKATIDSSVFYRKIIIKK